MDFNGSRTDFYNDYYRYASLIRGNHSDITILGYKDAVYLNPVYDDYATATANPDWFLTAVGAESTVTSYTAVAAYPSSLTAVHPSAAAKSAYSISFNGTGTRLEKVGVELRKTGSPNALVKAALYAHSGTYGSSSVPTGSPLETSTTIINSSSTLTTSYAFYNFTFASTTQLTADTKYCVVVYVDSGTVDASNYIRGSLAAVGHSGNIAEYASSAWTANTGYDARFYVYGAANDYIYSAYWGCYLMDVSNTGWQQHFADYVNAKLAQGTGTAYSGVFVDDVWDDLNDYTAGFNATVPQAKLDNWHSDMEAFLTYINSDIAGIVLVNSDEFDTHSYLNLVDGQMLEGYVHTSWDDPDTWDSTHLNLGTAHYAKSASGKIIFCSSGSSTYDADILSRCYNNFVNNSTDLEHSYFAFNGYSSSDPHFEYYEIMDTELPGGATPTPTAAPTAPHFSGDVNGPSWSGNLTALGVGLTIALVVFAPLIAERRRR